MLKVKDEYSTKPPLNEQIDELRRKLQLLDGDRKAYHENAEWTKNKNQEKIDQLRRENKELRYKLQDLLEGDEKVLNTAFDGRRAERAAVRNKTGETAIVVTDQQHSDNKKRLNALKHETAVKQKQLEELQTRYDQMIKDAEEAVKTDAGESETATKLRMLENSLDKAELKCNEATTIQRTYNQIKDHLLKESLTYNNRLDELEKQIASCTEELRDLKTMQKDAVVARENAANEFAKYEDRVYKERKEREICLETKKKEAEQKKQQAERIDRRLAQMAQTPPDEAVKEMTEQEREKVTSYEEAFEKIYEETGVKTMQEVVERYKGQEEKSRRLQHDKTEATEKIARLQDEKANLNKKFEEMKYSGEQKMSEGQRRIEEHEDKLKVEEAKKEEARKRMEYTNKLLVKVKSDIEHLANKLHNLKATKSQVANNIINTKSDEYILDLLSVTDDKLFNLYEELEKQGMSETEKQMKEEGVYYATTVAGDAKLPAHNTRITLHTKHQDKPFEDEDGSADEGDDDFKANRDQLKQASKQMVELKTKRHTKNKK